MSTDTREARLQQRIAQLYATDPQFAAALPDRDVSAEVDRDDARLTDIISAIMTGYADRPALGQRAAEFVTDPQTGRTSMQLLPGSTPSPTASCTSASRRSPTPGTTIRWHPATGSPYSGFTSVDYTTIDIALIGLGAVAVPLQTSAAVESLRPIVAETEPSLIATSIAYLDDAVELALSGHRPDRIVVFDVHEQVDDQREALQAATARLAGAVPVETLTDVLRRGAERPAVAPHVFDDADPLRLLIYTSGSTGAPKGAMYPESKVAGMWRASARVAWDQQATALPSISLSFMPMSHVMGRGLLCASLGTGGTVYFAARSDLSTLLEDLRLVRPTQLGFVPRIWDMLFQEFAGEVERRLADSGDPGADRNAVEAAVLAEQREELLGGRFVSAMTGSAPISPEMKTWVERLLDMHLVEGTGRPRPGRCSSTATSSARPYWSTNSSTFRTWVTSAPTGPIRAVNCWSVPPPCSPATTNVPTSPPRSSTRTAYRTGDIVAEIGPDQVEYLDRRNNVLKLAQGEFVTVSKLEAVFAGSPLVRQIYVYGNSARSYLLAVVVPTEEAIADHDAASLKRAISASLQNAAKAAGLQSYELPRDFLVETEPFTLENGLLTGIRKLARPKLKERYGDRLEQLYADLAAGQADELRSLRHDGENRPVAETVARAAAALLGAAAADVQPDSHFTDLGGDSLSALTFGNLLHEIFGVEVPVGVIVSPASDLASIAAYIETERASTGKRPTYASVHGRDATEVHARDLTLDKFIDAETLSAADQLPRPAREVRTVLLTGATGFLGRYLALEWLERMALVDGTVICLVRAKDDAAARKRLDDTFDSGDAALLAHYRELAAEHLEVLAGDKGEADLGLSQEVWQRLADTVDLIVDPAALVNHVLPYSQLFGPNALGTAELIRLALTSRVKPFTYVSTIGVGAGIEPGRFNEDEDIRVASPTRVVDDSYANGYGNSKWAGEVLLREAHDLCGLPVAVFRCDMILADTTYAGQLNLPDMFTRMMLSLVATGIAPKSFYELDADGNRQRAHYDGLPVEFVAEAISALGAQAVSESGAGFATFHVMNPYDDGIGLDEFVDWLIEAGYRIDRIDDYAAWLQRFETAVRALPERTRQYSLLPLLHNYQRPSYPISGSIAPTDRFRAAVQDAKIGPDKDIPHVTPAVIVKYATDLELLGLL